MALAQTSGVGVPSRISSMDPNFDRPKSALARGVQITEFKETAMNPEPVIVEETEILLEQYLSPRKLKLLTGTDDLEEVTSLDLKVNTQDTSLGNFGALLPNLTQLKMSESVVHSIRDIGSSLRGVRVLWMCQCGLHEVDGISSMTSLQELYLAYNEMVDISPLSMLDDLQILDIEGNNIDDIAQMHYLALCPNLKRLTIEGNPVCVMKTPHSEEVNYNYREAVKSILPNVEILDDEPLIAGSQPSMSLNAFDRDWEYLEELQHDALLQSPVDNDTFADNNTATGSRPSTAALRPATAFRPGSALRPSSGFRPSTASAKRPATISGRPSTSIRPTTAFAERPASSDAVETTDGASDLTLGGVICGNPSRALRERRKRTPSKHEKDDDCLQFMTTQNTDKKILQVEEEEEESDVNIVDELKEWRKSHNERMAKLEDSKCAQVLVIDHDNDSADSISDAEQINVNRSSIAQKQKSPKSRKFGFGDKHDEIYDVDNDMEQDVLKVHRPASPSRRSSSSGSSRLEDKQRPLINQKQDYRFSSDSLNGGRVNTSPDSTVPYLAPRSLSTRPVLPTPPRIRRQLPQVPSLPSKPAAPKS